MRQRDPFTIPTAIVTALAAIAGGFCGFIAAVGYAGRIDIRLCMLLGIVLGGGSGLAAGIFWCRILRRTVERDGEGRMVGPGAGYGLLAGLASTVVLHAGLSIGSLNPTGLQFLPIGFACALAVGAPLGAIGGFWLRWAARAASKADGAPAPAAPAEREEAP
jgi:hypothetical protein